MKHSINAETGFGDAVIREPCPRCDGCGRIANSEAGEPWRVWEALPEASAVAVRLGIVKPILCPDCAGTGRRREEPAP
jgi:hypothetical protein